MKDTKGFVRDISIKLSNQYKAHDNERYFWTTDAYADDWGLTPSEAVALEGDILSKISNHAKSVTVKPDGEFAVTDLAHLK
jgi:hypothetical protein